MGTDRHAQLVDPQPVREGRTTAVTATTRGFDVGKALACRFPGFSLWKDPSRAANLHSERLS